MIERGHWVRISRAKVRCFTDSSWFGVSGLPVGQLGRAPGLRWFRERLPLRQFHCFRRRAWGASTGPPSRAGRVPCWRLGEPNARGQFPLHFSAAPNIQHIFFGLISGARKIGHAQYSAHFFRRAHLSELHVFSGKAQNNLAIQKKDGHGQYLSLIHI